MMAGNPSRWSMQSNLRSSSTSDEATISQTFLISQTHPSAFLLPVQYLHTPSSSSTSSSNSLAHHDNHAQDFTHPWSQLLMGGLASEDEERYGLRLFQSTRVMSRSLADEKQEMTTQNNNNLYGYHHEEAEARVSSIINNNNNNNNNVLDFSTRVKSLQADSQQEADLPNSECNSTTAEDLPNKKLKVQSSSIPPLKVRKEKLGDRITALHQMVSPFGKTDTASVLLEAIGYVRFLHGQIEALSSPYLGNNSASVKNQHSVHGERNCLFPDHPGQLLNDASLKRRGAAMQEDHIDAPKDLKSRGLCLVPISCSQLVGSDNGADYWAPSFSGGF